LGVPICVLALICVRAAVNPDLSLNPCIDRLIMFI
jgi:hypothetical protein